MLRKITRKFSKYDKKQKEVIDYVIRNNQIAKYALVQFIDSQSALSDLETDEKYTVYLIIS